MTIWSGFIYSITTIVSLQAKKPWI